MNFLKNIFIKFQGLCKTEMLYNKSHTVLAYFIITLKNHKSHLQINYENQIRVTD